MHLGDHFCGEKKGHDEIQGECDVLQGWDVLESLGSIHTDRHKADESAGPQQSTHPFLVHPVNVCIVVQILIRPVVRQRQVVSEACLSVHQHD